MTKAITSLSHPSAGCCVSALDFDRNGMRAGFAFMDKLRAVEHKRPLLWEDLPTTDSKYPYGLAIAILTLRAMDYRSEYLYSTWWLNRKERALNLGHRRCALDYSHKGIMDVDHLRYDYLGDEPDSDLMVLCRRCHDMKHSTALLQFRENMRLQGFIA